MTLSFSAGPSRTLRNASTLTLFLRQYVCLRVVCEWHFAAGGCSPRRGCCTVQFFSTSSCHALPWHCVCLPFVTAPMHIVHFTVAFAYCHVTTCACRCFALSYIRHTHTHTHINTLTQRQTQTQSQSHTNTDAHTNTDTDTNADTDTCRPHHMCTAHWHAEQYVQDTVDGRADVHGCSRTHPGPQWPLPLASGRQQLS